MSHPTAKFSLVASAHGHEHSERHYPRQQVWWSALAFCLSVWGVVIFAVTHYT